MPIIRYKNAAGQRIPSFSTIKNQWGDGSEGLYHYFYNKGAAGIPYDAKPEADIGTITHAMIDADVKGIEADLKGYPQELIEKAFTCYKSYERWKEGHDFKPIQTELSLISEQHQFGGTIDCVAQIEGRLAIPDWKTGLLYPSHRMQVVAYRHLWDENFPEHPITGGYHILKIGKDVVWFDYQWFEELPGVWELFLKLREIYELGKQIKKMK